MPNVATLAADPSAAAMAFPFLVRSQPDADINSIDMGPQLTGRKSFFLAPWHWQNTGYIKNTRFEFSGDIGVGKSSLAKSCGLEFAGMQGPPIDLTPQYLKVRFINRRQEGDKGEYDAAVESVHGEVIALNNHRLNPFAAGTLKVTVVDLQETAVSLTEIHEHRALAGYEGMVLQICINQMLRQDAVHPRVLAQKLRKFSDEGVYEYFKTNDDELYEALKVQYAGRPKLINQLGLEMDLPDYIDLEEMHSTASRLAAIWHDIAGAAWGYTFSGDKPLDSLFTHRIASFNSSGVSPIVETALNTLFLQCENIAINTGDQRILADVSFTDETGIKVEDIAWARATEQRARLARQSKEASFIMTQYVTDTRSAGEPGSALRRHAEVIDQAIGARIIGRQPNRKDIRDRLYELGFERQDVEFITGATTHSMPNYCFAFKADGRTPIFFRRFISQDMKKLTETNAASASMIQPIPLTDDPEAVARLERIRQAELARS
jgi:hypothetical protein